MDFDKPEEDDDIAQLKDELEKLRYEKELGWVDTNQNKNSAEKEILNQEIARLNEKNKRLTHQIEDFKKKEADWNSKDDKYQTICKNFKKTIAELKKEIDSLKSREATNKSFEALFSEQNKLKKEYEEQIKVLYSIINDLVEENQSLRDDRGKKRNYLVDFLDGGMKMFEEVA